MRGQVLLPVLGAIGGVVEAMRVQKAFESNEMFQKAVNSLGISQKDVDAIPENLKEVWSEMSNLFPEDTAKLQFVSKPRSNVRTRDDWDFHVTSKKVESYKLRARALKDPAKLGIDPGVKQYSGYLDVEEGDKHFFFYFLESRNDPKNDPVVLWLNGGPGCSSLTGLFFELGPSSVGKDLKPIKNPYSWNNNASVIFLDQPVNAGYSYSSSAVSNTVAASKDVYAFLQLFFEQFPEYQSGQEFHIAGESYAGHYIPAFASEILSHPVEKRSFELSSVLIGNGLTDPLTQYGYYEPMACGRGDAPAVLNDEECSTMNNTLPRCLNLIRTCYSLQNVWSCVPASVYCNNVQLNPFQQSGTNVYDVRKPCEGELCYGDLKYMSQYLNLPEVKEALGAEVDNFESCNFDINRNFLLNGDWMKPYHHHVSELLDKDLPVLIYAGDKDFICNWLGNQAWTNILPWKYSNEFLGSPIRKWDGPSGEQAGEVKNFKHFTYLRVFDAGHMVPYDVPENALSMLNTWLSGDHSF
ncbi:carboxypeptidase C PRC1 Ecym_5642 [Eremothecium cymbalariae DBVPG|uniref:Carboxypeptidase n=1 Tax=Eremothecium cymbalariae (strain CBS 270.75 / DBVPG 7215 / KCTC 17166 / NRRL Y-17582) TaxID=931890 RepID=I6NE85_ERECY|nr:hypothetical protein Ecym_5642 [Eremothecium cymbalariae DBVPG\